MQSYAILYIYFIFQEKTGLEYFKILINNRDIYERFLFSSIGTYFVYMGKINIRK